MAEIGSYAVIMSAAFGLLAGAIIFAVYMRRKGDKHARSMVQ